MYGYAVLILIVVEDGLVQQYTDGNGQTVIVLILIVVDDGSSRNG